MEFITEPAMDGIMARHRSWAWCLGYGPECTLEIPAVVSPGPPWVLDVRAGVLVSVRQGLDARDAAPLSAILEGCRLVPGEVTGRLRAARADLALATALQQAGF